MANRRRRSSNVQNSEDFRLHPTRPDHITPAAPSPVPAKNIDLETGCPYYLSLSDRDSAESPNVFQNFRPPSRIQSTTSEEFITDIQMNNTQPPLSSDNSLTITPPNYGQSSFENHNPVQETISTTLSNLFSEENDTSTACNSVVGSSATLDGNNISEGPSDLNMDVEECPTRDTNTSKFKMNLDVRYFDNLTSRIKGAIMPIRHTCQQGYCHNYRERWEQHNLMYHQGMPPAHLCHHQHPGHAKVFHTTGSETMHVGRVSSAHATQTIQPSKRDRCIEFKVPKVSFANQVQHTSNVMVKFTKSTSVADFSNCADRANIATSIIKSILADPSESCESQNDVGNPIESMPNRSEVNLRSSNSLLNSVKSASCSWGPDDTNADVQSTRNIADTAPKLTLRHKIYEEQLAVEIYKWLDDVPVFPDQKESAKDLRMHLGKTLIQRLIENSHRVNEQCYGDIVKKCVEHCVNELPMWCPGNKDDEVSFRQRLSENLVNRICLLNEKVFEANHIDFDVRISEILNWPDDRYIGNASTSKTLNPSKIDHFEGRSIEEIISLHVTRWISDDIIRIYPNYSECQFVSLLLESLKPFLHQGSKITFGKLSKRIFEILDELPLTICSETDKALRLYRLSEDLADVIRQHGAIYCRDILSWEESSINYRSSLSFNEFKNIIKVEVKVWLQKFRINFEEDIINNITEVLAKDFDAIRSGTKSDEPLTALCKLLQKTGLMKDELSAVALNLRNCIRTLPVVYDLEASQGKSFPIRNSPVTNTVVVFRNEQGEKSKTQNKDNSTRPHLSTTTNIETSKGLRHEKPPQQSTPKRGRHDISFAPDVSSIGIDDSLPITYKMPRLSPQAADYLEAVENEVEKWIDSLPAMQFSTPEDLKFKRTMIKDLAADILDRARWRQLHSDRTSDADDLEHVRFIIFRWIWRISDVHSFERDDQFNNKLLQLVNSLRNIAIPDLTTPYLGNRKDIKVATGQRPTGMDILEDEISIFLDEHPPHIFVDRDKASRNKKIHELATDVREYIVNEQNPSEKIEAAVAQWIAKVVNPETNVTDMKILLKERISRVPQTVFQPHVKTRSEMDTERGIDDGIFWLQKQRFYLQCTPEGQKEQERRTAAMVKSLLELSRLLPPGTVKQEDRSNQILVEMVDHLKFFPTGNGQRMGEIFSPEQLKLVAIEVVKYLAACDKVNKQARQDLSSQIADRVNTWLQQIPIKSTTIGTNEQFETLKANFILSVVHLKMLEHEQPADMHEDLLKSEIKKFLQACPLDERVPNTEKNRLQKVQELVDMIKVDQSGKVDDKSAHLSQRMNGSTSRLPCVCPTANDKKLKEFLKEHMQKFQTGDSMAKEAFADRLFREFQNVNLKPCQMEACQFSCTSLAQHNQSFNMKRFNQELVMIKSITEWLKDLPLSEEFYLPGNQERSKIISEIAEKIYNTFAHTEPLDDKFLYNVILDWIKKLPLENEFQRPVMLDAMTQALKNRIERVLNHYNADQLQSFQDQNQEPSSSVAHESIASTSEHDSRSDGQKLEDFVENFMTMNRDIDISDELIRDAYAYKLLQALKITIKQLQAPVSDKYELYEALGEVPMPGDASVVRYTRQMRLDKEVQEWMNLLPKVPADKKEQKWRDKQCAKLAKYIADVHEAQITNPWHNYQNELVKMITETLDHVLEPGHKDNYMELTNGLLIRQLAVADEFYPKTQPPYSDSQNVTNFDRNAALHKRYTPQEESLDYEGFSANVPQSSSRTELHYPRLMKPQKPMDLLFKAIEDWSKEVPLQVDEERKKSLREYIVQVVLRKVGQLNMDPNIYNDNLLYIAALTDEIDELLSALPQNPTLQSNKERLKSKLVKDLSEVNVIQKNVNAGETYKKKLEDSIETSLPKPMNREEKAGIDLIKTAVAEEFILEKYQQGDSDLKSRYEDKVISDLSNVINASVFSQSDMSDIHNSIKSELEAVPAPDKEVVLLQVEEIKTKNVIAEWFDGMPLVSPQNNQELLDRDRIQSLLAKRLHEIENDESDRDFHMMIIITKWLQKLRFHDGQERFIDDMAQNLITQLKATEVSRRASLKNYDDAPNSKRLTNVDIERQEIMMTSTRPTSLNVSSTNAMTDAANKNCTEVIFEIVQRWCQQLPLEATTPEDEDRNSEFKNRMATKILFKIGELNRDDLIFNDEMLYSEELAEVVDKIISSLTQNEALKRNKTILTKNLVGDLIEIRPCIKEEKDRHHYKQQLYNSVAQVTKQPPNISREQKALLENFQEEVVDDFIEYNYHRDESGKKCYKEKILSETQKYLSATEKDTTTAEELFQELSKVPVPTDAAVGEEIREIRLKQQISDWMEELPIPKADPVESQRRNKIKGVLAKRLNEIEKQGASCNAQQKMQSEITKYTKKVAENVSNETLAENVNRLTETLNKTAPERRMIRPTQRAPKQQSNQRSQASDSFFAPAASTSKAYLRPTPPTNQRCNQTCPQLSHLPNQTSAADFTPYVCSGSSSAYIQIQHPLRRESQEGSTQTGQLTPCPGSFTQAFAPRPGPFTQTGSPFPGPFVQPGMGEAYTENAILCPSYSDMEAWANCQRQCQQEYDGEIEEYVACPYFSNEEEARLSKDRTFEGYMAHMKGSESSERCGRGRKTHCMCPDTDGLLTVVPCPIHEKAVWRHPGTRYSRF